MKASHPWSHDVWSLGVIFCEIVTGFPMNSNDKSVLELMQNNQIKTVVGKGLFGVQSLYKQPAGDQSEQESER